MTATATNAEATAPRLLAFPLEVAKTERLSPSFVRITLTGAALADFHGGGPLGPRDQRIKLLLPTVGSAQPQLDDLSAGWYVRWRALPPQLRGQMRTYTVRAARLEGANPQIDLDFVLHGPVLNGPGLHGPGRLDGTGHSGPGSAWAARARSGDPVTLLGPNARSATVAGIEWQPPAPRPHAPVRVLLAGDETAVPAISAVVESLPEGYRGHVVVEVPEAADFSVLSGRSDLEVIWLARGRHPHGARLREAVAALLADCPPSRLGDGSSPKPMAEVDIDTEVLWDTPSYLGLQATPAREPFYAWIAGEAATVRDLRRTLVTVWGVDRGSVAFMGYWRQGRAELT